jgi:aminopeptidase N
VDNFTTSGFVRLTFTVISDNAWYGDDIYTKIYLHAKDIAIDESSVVVKNQAGEALRVKGHEYGFERDFYVIHLGQDMQVGETYTLEMSFTSYLNDYLVGFYRSEYKVGEETKYLAVTQFESHYARQAFPCLDEPDKKATFSVKLTTKKGTLQKI